MPDDAHVLQTEIQTQKDASAPRKRQITVSVRTLVEFALKSGDLGGAGQFVGATRALDGTRGHQRIQRLRPPGYQAEIVLSRQIDQPEFVLTIKGRVDGILCSDNSVVIEEIKTVTGTWDGVADPLHWAQAKLYAFFYLGNAPVNAMEVQLTYLNLDDGGVTVFRQAFSAGELTAFFESVLGPYLDWMRRQVAWWDLRGASIQALAFPFATYRPGQRELAVAVYRAFQRGANLFAEAPTGIGKTVSVLFPAIKALGENLITKIFYVTAKTPGRTIAENAVTDLKRAGLRLRSVTLTARDKVCVNHGEPCDTMTCPRAIGYYDRYKTALRAGFDVETLTRAEIEALGAEFQVCPFALALDLAAWADLIICDYNHAFDPKVYLRQFFDEKVDCALLVDEAHNLADRARDMFSAKLTKESLIETKHAVADLAPVCAKSLSKILRRWNQLAPGQPADTELPKSILPSLENFQKEAERWLVQNRPAPGKDRLLNLYFQINSFLRTADLFDDAYRTIYGPDLEWIRLFCIDPSPRLEKAVQRVKTTVFFSATLRPVDYFRSLYGGHDGDLDLQLPSPFPAQNFRVLLAGRIDTQFKQRTRTSEQVCQAIAAMVRSRRGNYLVYFPSYQYLAGVRARFQLLFPEIELLTQSPGMSEADREMFLESFHAAGDRTLVAFAVLGGIFGEGIDLVGERLVGAVIVGVGLPQLCLERDLIRDYYDAREIAGFDYAYVLPGIQRVLQAVGRVIRSETDRGLALLIDTRFGQARYRELLPSWWTPTVVATPDEINAIARTFWPK